MNKFLYITKKSLKDKFKSKSFIITNIILIICIISLTNIDNIINYFGGDFTKETNILVYDKTNYSYEIFKNNMNKKNNIIDIDKKYNIKKIDNNSKENIKDKKDILITIDSINDNLSVNILSKEYIDKTLYSLIELNLNNTNKAINISKLKLSKNDIELMNKNVSIKRDFVDKDKTEKEEKNEFVMNIVYPIFIFPFYMLILLVIQMIGAEINEEKSTRSMEIIISNVSPKCHFFSKIISSNLFVLAQSLLLLLYGLIGIKIRGSVINSSINDVVKDFVDSKEILNSIIEVIPYTLIIMVLTILCYSIIAGILASVTTNMEDFQQLQTPLIIISLIGFYLSFMNSMFEGSIIIKILSYVPLISAILSPCLFISGVTGVEDIIVSILIMIVTLYLILKYGIRIYKDGLLNYSGNNLWKKMIKSLKD